MYPVCQYRIDDQCKVATSLALMPVIPSPWHCDACTKHLTLPQRINGVTCAMAYKKQKDSGLEPDPKLFQCIKTEQTFNQEVLTFLRNKWKLLHTFKCKPWDAIYAKSWYESWLIDLPQFGCMSCSSHWDTITRQWPINFRSHSDYFFSTHYAHNIVNRKLFKEWYPIRQAIKHWSHIYWIDTGKELFDDSTMQTQRKTDRDR